MVNNKEEPVEGDLASKLYRLRHGTLTVYVPRSIGICVDGYGFLGLLDLGVWRRINGLTEYLGLLQEHYGYSYLVDYHTNENTGSTRFRLRDKEPPVGRQVYYVTDEDNFEKVGDISSYVLYLDYDTYCRFNPRGLKYPDVEVGNHKWKGCYRVVRD